MIAPTPRRLALQPLALAALAALAALTPAAWAAPTSLFAGTDASVTSGAATPSAGLDPLYRTSSSLIADADGRAEANSFANAFGAYAVRSSAEGRGQAAAQTRLTYSLVNTSAFAQSFTMSLWIYGGSLSTLLNNPEFGLTGGERLTAQYAARVTVGGNTLWSSTATLTRDANGSQLTKSGVDFNAQDDGDDAFYAWDGRDYLVDLGVLGAGESLEIVTELTDSVFADVGTYSFGCEGGGYGYGGYGGYGGSCFKGWASAFYGDPLSIEGMFDMTPPAGVTFQGTPVANGVPEPHGAALALLALGALAATGRRRRRAATPAAA